MLTAACAYIVVENDMQKKMLELKQRQTLAGQASFDLVESPAPPAWLLVALSAAAGGVQQALRRRTAGGKA